LSSSRPCFVFNKRGAQMASGSNMKLLRQFQCLQLLLLSFPNVISITAPALEISYDLPLCKRSAQRERRHHSVACETLRWAEVVLDENLPRLVEQMVQGEIERIARAGTKSLPLLSRYDRMVLLFYPDGAYFPRRQDDQGDRPGPPDIPEHDPQGTAIRRDIVRIRADRTAAAELFCFV
jgi:hypothetical protein